MGVWHLIDLFVSQFVTQHRASANGLSFGQPVHRARPQVSFRSCLVQPCCNPRQRTRLYVEVPDGAGDFDSTDLILAFAAGHYESPSAAARDPIQAADWLFSLDTHVGKRKSIPRLTLRLRPISFDHSQKGVWHSQLVITVVLTLGGGARHGERKLSAICIALPRFAAKRPTAATSQIASLRDEREPDAAPAGDQVSVKDSGAEGYRFEPCRGYFAWHCASRVSTKSSAPYLATSCCSARRRLLRQRPERN
jgi:hypothetical protein